MSIELGLSINKNISQVSNSEAMRRDSALRPREFDKTLEKVKSSEKKHAPSQKIENKPETQATDKTNKAEESSAKQDKKINPKSAMEVFLDRMQNEFGVTSEQLLNAFSNLSVEELTGKPEESAEAIIDNLGLSGQQSEQALELFNQMLAVTAAVGMSNYLSHQGQDAQFQVLDKRQSQLNSTKQALNSMSDRFFVKGEHAHLKTGFDQQTSITQAGHLQNSNLQTQNQMLQNQNQQNQNQTQSSKQGAQFLNAMNSSGGELLSSDTLQAAGQLPVNSTIQPNMMAKNMSSSGMGFENATGQSLEGFEPVQNLSYEKLAKLNNSSGELQAAVNQPFSLSDVMTEMPFTKDVANINTQALASDVANVNGIPTNGVLTEGIFKSDSSMTGEEGEESLEGHEFNGQNASVQQNAQMKGQKTFMVGTPQPTPAELNNNVQEIISKANYLAQKGGGEMKVILNPEGLGEVSLKVQMLNGNVNVEMITDNTEAKKALEKGLGELKDSLALHKLNLDSIKIDSSKESSNQFDHKQQDLERNFQQRFLGDFQQRNNNFRREMYEFGSASMPSSQTRDQAINSKYEPSAKRKADSSRRLDLVA